MTSAMILPNTTICKRFVIVLNVVVSYKPFIFIDRHWVNFYIFTSNIRELSYQIKITMRSLRFHIQQKKDMILLRN